MEDRLTRGSINQELLQIILHERLIYSCRRLRMVLKISGEKCRVVYTTLYYVYTIFLNRQTSVKMGKLILS